MRVQGPAMKQGCAFCLLLLLLSISCVPEGEIEDPPLLRRSVSSRALLYDSYGDAKEGRRPVGLLKPDQLCEIHRIWPSHEWIIFDICEIRVNDRERPFYTYPEFLGVRINQKRFRDALDEEGNLITGSERVDRNNPLPFDYQPNDLVDINRNSAELSFEMKAPVVGEKSIMLREEALTAFEKMFIEAADEGIILRIVSGYRSAKEQQRIFSHLTGRIAKQRSVAMPTFSEHQLGTTADISCPELDYYLMRDFEKTEAGRWAHKNCERFGIRVSYSRKTSEQEGYTYEPWHLRYIGE